MRLDQLENFAAVPIKPTLASLELELSAALALHADADRAESAARSEATAARNRINAAQKALDAAYVELRKKAPWNTEWHGKDHPGVPVSG